MTETAKLGRPESFSEDQLLDAVVVVLAREGYGDAHVSLIAEAAGATAPTLYARLGSKDEMYSRAVEREARLLGETLLNSYENALGRSLRDRVAIGTDALFNFCEERPDGFLLLFGSRVGGPAIDREALVLRQSRAGVARIQREYLTTRGFEVGPGVDLLASMTAATAIDAARFAMEQPEVDLNSARRLTIGAVDAMLRNLDPDLVLGDHSTGKKHKRGSK